MLECWSQGPRDLRLACWDCVFESHREHGCLSVVSVVRQRSLRRADHSSKGVLPTVMSQCVWSRNLVNEEAMAHWGLSGHKQTNIVLECVVKCGKGAVTSCVNVNLQSRLLLKPSIWIYPDFKLRTSELAKYGAAIAIDIPWRWNTIVSLLHDCGT